MLKIIRLLPLLLFATACGDALYAKVEFTIAEWIVWVIAGLSGFVLLSIFILLVLKFNNVTVRVFNSNAITKD